MDDGKQNQRRVPQIELPPPLVPKPPGGTPNRGKPKEESGLHTINQEKPASSDPALFSGSAKEVATERNSPETKDELAVREPAGDAPPVPEVVASIDGAQEKKEPSPSGGNAVIWVGIATLIGFIAIAIALQSANPHGPEVTQRTPVETTSSTEPAVSNSANPVELRSPLATPAASLAPNYSPSHIQQTLASDTPAVRPSPVISRVSPRTPSVATPAPKTDLGRTYVWRGQTYYIPPNQMQRFNAIKKAGVTQLTAMQKLKDEINSIGFQMQKADKKAKNRLSSRQDALSAQYSEASAEYARVVSEMDQLISSFANP
ncbi:MAG: hypothetical protein WDN28_30905 [Chthoniobacter sp.]